MRNMLPATAGKPLVALFTLIDTGPRPFLGDENEMKKIAFALVALTLSLGAWAHSGGTDKNGCHQEKSTGTRHCH